MLAPSTLSAAQKVARYASHDLAMSLAQEREEDLRVRHIDRWFKDRLRANASNNILASSRRDALHDDALFQALQDSLRAGVSVRLCAKQGCPVINIPTPFLERERKKFKEDIRREGKGHEDLKDWGISLWTPHWDHTGDKMKAFSWCMAMHEQGARTFSLNLGPEVIEAGRNDPKGLADHIRRRIDRHLKKAAKELGLPAPAYFFTVEASDLIQPHLHGAIVLPSEETAYRAFRSALMDAGGQWRNSRSPRQLDTRLLTTPAKWIGYITKWGLGSAIKIQGKTFAASHEARRMGKDWYERARATGELIRADSHYQATEVTPSSSD